MLKKPILISSMNKFYKQIHRKIFFVQNNKINL